MTEEEKEKLESEYFRSYCDLRIYNRNDGFDKTEVSFALQHPGGGVTGEIIVEWISLGSHGVSPQIQVFADAVHVLACFQDLIDALHRKYEGTDYSPEDLIETLEECGFMNSTTAFKGDYIPDELFEEYQKKRKQRKNREKSLNNLLED